MTVATVMICADLGMSAIMLSGILLVLLCLLIPLLYVFLTCYGTFTPPPPCCTHGVAVVPFRPRGEPDLQSGRYEHYFAGENGMF